jgi:hypothetical protein
MDITRTSPITGKVCTMDLPITQEQLDRYYVAGELLQNAFPNLTAGEREFVKTGITDEEWSTLFGGGEEE